MILVMETVQEFLVVKFNEILQTTGLETVAKSRCENWSNSFGE